ncbi:MAG: hypothetical protein U1E78_03540 [Gammaproteobacteria bacterium]
MSLDLLQNYTRTYSDQSTVLIAPLLGPDNLRVRYPEVEQLRYNGFSPEPHNIGFVIGKELRNLFDLTFDISCKSYSAAKKYISSIKDKLFRDRLKQYASPDHTELSKSEQICMILDSGYQYDSSDGIKVYIESDGLTESQYELYNQAFHDAVEEFEEHSAINVEFLDFPDEADIIAGKLDGTKSSFLSLVSDVGGRAEYPVEGGVQDFQIKSEYLVSYGEFDGNHYYSNFLRNLLLHEAGHGLIGLLHPFQIHYKIDWPNHWIDRLFFGSFLDIPELTRMTYRSNGKSEHVAYPKQTLLKMGLAYCDAVVAQQKYGPQTAWYGRSITINLLENTREAITIPTKLASTLTLDARNVTIQSVEFSLGPGFRPTKLEGSHYYIGPGRHTNIHAYTSLLNDTIRFGHPKNAVFVTGGLGKSFIIRSDSGLNEVYGFRVDLDRIEFQGVKESELQIKFAQNYTQIQIDSNTLLNLYGVEKGRFHSVMKSFESHREDDIDYISNLYLDVTGDYGKFSFVAAIAMAGGLVYISYDSLKNKFRNTSGSLQGQSIVDEGFEDSYIEIEVGECISSSSDAENDCIEFEGGECISSDSDDEYSSEESDINLQEEHSPFLIYQFRNESHAQKTDGVQIKDTVLNSFRCRA